VIGAAGELAGGATLPAATLAAAPGVAATAPVAIASAAPSVAGSATEAAAPTAASSSGGFWSTLGRFAKNYAAPVIGAGAAIYSAKTQANAQKDAAQLQAQATQQALDFQKSVYNDQWKAYQQELQNLSPYRNTGVSSIQALAGGLGLPDPGGVSQVPSNAMSPAIFQLNANSSAGKLPPQPGIPQVPFTPPTSGYITVPQPSGASNAGQSTVQSLAPYVQPATTSAVQGSTVRMQGPDGSQEAVPVAEVGHYLSRGARIVA
jgi:hypothetical protein